MIWLNDVEETVQKKVEEILHTRYNDSAGGRIQAGEAGLPPLCGGLYPGSRGLSGKCRFAALSVLRTRNNDSAGGRIQAGEAVLPLLRGGLYPGSRGLSGKYELRNSVRVVSGG